MEGSKILHERYRGCELFCVYPALKRLSQIINTNRNSFAEIEGTSLNN